MSFPATEIPPRLSESQREALISLLGDEDPAIHETVRQKLLAYGHEVAEWLRPHTLSSDPLLRRRARAIIQLLACQDADNEFLAYCLRQGEDLDLEEATWLLAKTKYPDLHADAYTAMLDGFAADLRDRLDFTAGAARILGGINDYLFREQGFQGNEQNYYDPDNSYLNRVIDRRTGNPISLCAVYLFVSRRLHLPVTGIGLPGHFICRFQSTTEEIYIDAFNRGRLLNKADCVKYLHHTSHGVRDEFLAPVLPRRMLMRMCSNLHQIYQQMEQAQDAERFQRYLVALAK